MPPDTPLPAAESPSSRRPTSTSRPRFVGLLLAGIAIIGGAYYGINQGAGKVGASSNAIMVISPYVDSGTWVFDDPAVGLLKEPFVAGVPEMIDELVKEIPHAKQGFRLLFSAQPFPGFQKQLKWTRSDGTGNYYQLDDPPMEGWICPALFQYYAEPPRNLYVKAEAITR